MINKQQRFAHVQPTYPVHHKRKVPFSPKISVPATFPSQALEIRRLDNELDRFILSEQDYLTIVIDAFASNIHYSTKIECNPLPFEEVRRLTRDSFEGKATDNPGWPSQEIINHVASWQVPEYFGLPWSIEKVKRVHKILMDGVLPEDQQGTLRDHPSQIEDAGVAYFFPAPPQYIGEELGALVDWTNDQAGAFDPVVAATVFFHEFESIHPFSNGNGRAGRTLFHVYLQNMGLPNAHLCRIEQQILSDPNMYYSLLAWTDQTGSYTELIEYITEAILAAYRSAVSQLGSMNLLGRDLDENAKRILIRAKRQHEWFTLAQASSWVQGITEQTVRKHLNHLTTLGALEKQGRTRATKSRFPMRFPQLTALTSTLQTTLGGDNSIQTAAATLPQTR